jgi:hypothetical protein
LLPPADFSPAAVQKWPIVQNIREQPQGAAGEPWGAVAVECAARLAFALAPHGDLDRHWRRLGLAAIIAPTPTQDVPRPTELSFELRTVGGTEIIWGLAPEVADSEPSVLDKLAGLDRVAASAGGLDGPGAPFRIDLRRPEVISFRPLNDVRVR